MQPLPTNTHKYVPNMPNLATARADPSAETRYGGSREYDHSLPNIRPTFRPSPGPADLVDFVGLNENYADGADALVSQRRLR